MNLHLFFSDFIGLELVALKKLFCFLFKQIEEQEEVLLNSLGNEEL